MAFQAKLVSQGRSLANAREGGFRPLPLRILEVGIAECPGVQFHDRCADPYGSLELRGIRFDEEGDPRSGGSQPADEALQVILCASRIQAAFRGALLAPLRHDAGGVRPVAQRSEEHTSELQSLMRISYAVFCLKKKIKSNFNNRHTKQ